MSGAALAQGLVVAAVVGWSLVSALKRLLPATSRRLQARLVGSFDHPAAPAWLRALTAHLQPRSTAGASCSDGCSTCGGCAAALGAGDAPALRIGDAPAAEAGIAPLPLRFHPRARP